VIDADALLLFTRDGTTAFYANFYGWVNVVALLLQAFVASRLLKYGGFAALLLMLPVVALMSYSVMALLPVLAIVKFMKVAENATDYSINNTARSVLWLPLSPELIYKGKPTIDALFARFGDGLSALTVMIGVNLLMLPTASFFAINVALVVIWLAVSFVVIREHRRISEESTHDRA
jgi:AAA family ATP:ADP antiporter